jgi:hypothetical protein
MDKYFLHFAGVEIPAVQVGPDTHTTVELRDGRKIPAVFANMISLRGTNPDNGPVVEYLTLTPENKRFVTMRFTNVIGLDVDENGALLTVEELERQRAKDIMARQQVVAAAKAPIILSIADLVAGDDLDDIVGPATS